jgi:RNA polymerase primary sigma factor
LEGRDPLTLEEVGLRIGVTRERVRQLQELAIRKLRKEMTSMERPRTAAEIKEAKVMKEHMRMLGEIIASKSKKKT